MHHLDAQLWRNWQSTSERFRVARAALGHLVHDFRNGLSGVVGYVELLKHLLQAGSKELAFVEKMDLAASQALRDFSELSQSSDPQPHSPTTVDLAALAGEMVGAKQIVSSVPIQLQSNGAVRSGAGLNLRLVTGERVRLLAACGELLTNAIEAVSNAGPPILVSLRSFAPSELPEELGARRKMHALVVQNSGAFPQSMAARLGEPFISTKPGRAGTGLFRVIGTTVAHGGLLSVTTEADGLTTAVMLLPEAA